MNRNIWRLPLCVAISSVITTPCYAELTVLSGELYINTTLLENNDQIVTELGGEFINDVPGAIDIGGNINNGGLFNNYGMIHTNELLTGPLGNTLNNTGVFNNSGEFSAMTQFHLINSGELINKGLLTLQGTASEVLNSGIFINDYEVSLEGTLINETKGVVENNSYANISVRGKLENSGLFNNAGTLNLQPSVDSSINPEIPTELINSGEFNHSGDILTFNGLSLMNSGIFNNNGSFINSSNLYSASLKSINNVGVFNNNTTTSVEMITNQGTFNNNFDLTGVRSIENTGFMTNAGRLSSTTDLIINNANEFNSSGEITSTQSLTINNAGLFNSLGSINFSRESWINNAGTFNNGNSDIIQYENPIMNVQGSHINNTGTFNNYRGLVGSEIINDGILSNENTINVNQQIQNNGVINNSGSIEVVVASFFTGQVSTGLVNTSMGVINNVSHTFYPSKPSMLVFGELNNQGTINNGLDSKIEMGYKYDSASNIINSGTIINDGLITGYSVIGEDVSNSKILSTGKFINNGSVNVSQMDVSGILQGDGSVSLTNGLVITEAGTLAPGNSVGNMGIGGDLFLDGALDIEFDFANEYGFNTQLHDTVNVNFGDVYLGSNSVLDISLIGSGVLSIGFSLGDTFDLMIADAIIGDFGSFYYDALISDRYAPGSLAFQWSVVDGLYQDTLRLEVVSAVPVPAAVWLFISGLLGLLSVVARRKGS